MQPDKLETNAKSKTSLKTRGRPKKMKENINKIMDDEKVILGLRVAFLEELIRNQRESIEDAIEGEHHAAVSELRRQVEHRNDVMQDQIGTIAKQSSLIDKLQVTLDLRLGVDTEKEVEKRIREQPTRWTQFFWSSKTITGPLKEFAIGINNV